MYQFSDAAEKDQEIATSADQHLLRSSAGNRLAADAGRRRFVEGTALAPELQPRQEPAGSDDPMTFPVDDAANARSQNALAEVIGTPRVPQRPVACRYGRNCGFLRDHSER